MKWKRTRYEYGDTWSIPSREGKTSSEVEVWIDLTAILEIRIDPRTGKPWRSMKAAREWFTEVTEWTKNKEKNA
jgi:hypothetical protein